MLQNDETLWGLIARRDDLAGRFLWGVKDSVPLAELAVGSSLDCPADTLAGCSVLIATDDQLTAALAAIELDGIARRLVMCPPDLRAEHLPLVAEAAEASVIILDGKSRDGAVPDSLRRVLSSPRLAPTIALPVRSHRTEWVLLTSGTTGLPKLVAHTLSSLTRAIKQGNAAPGGPAVWSTFYDIRRYGGLQIFLRGMLGNGSLVLSSGGEPTADFLGRAGGHGVTHISGTPSHWRRCLMNPAAHRMAPRYVRLSGEIVDQSILNDLQAAYSGASVGHAFASTEAGVAFEVNDGLAGFPVDLIGRPNAEVELKIEDDSLRIRSARNATRYLGVVNEPLRDESGFIDTGDVLERRGDRYYFIGRRGGIINVGGLKVHPEEVEAVINRCPAVQMSLVKARKSPFTGAIVVADVVVRPEQAGASATILQSDIIAACRRELQPHKVPAAIRFVASLNVGTAGKLARSG